MPPVIREAPELPVAGPLSIHSSCTATNQGKGYAANPDEGDREVAVCGFMVWF